MSKGFVIMAQDTDKVSYTNCAKALELSIKRVMPNSNVTIITSDMLPYGDLGGYANDWQVYEASPYEYTIKLEADMYMPTSIDYWWEVLKERDVVVSTTIRDYKQNISHTRAYRRFIDDNKLPDTYNAITYFKKSETAKKFFETVKHVFENWSDISLEIFQITGNINFVFILSQRRIRFLGKKPICNFFAASNS